MKKESMRLWLVAALLFSVFPAEAADTDAVGRWSEQKAWAWRQKTGWWVGCNFLPSCAINQLEMFQADTFDPQTLDRELG
ncbi:MAG TPA: 1,4-beta-xylanase, partial [Candidatus Paceibacterota bacterium]|nr:1,4-beta-xylanase [Candidatus Paceibacterota bacterium]